MAARARSLALRSPPMADARFAALAAIATLGVAVASTLAGAWFVACVFALLCVGFAVRAAAGFRSRERR